MILPDEKIILVLGGSSDQQFLINTIQSMSYKTLCLDKNNKSVAKKESDYFLNVDFSNLEKVKKKIHKFKDLIVGVITMGSDCPVEVAKISKYLNLKSNSIKTSNICKNKLKMKKVFKDAKIKSAKYIYTNSANKIERFFLKNKEKPIIIKPTNLAGSRGVYLLRKLCEIRALKKKIEKIINKKKFLVEEFLEGPQISTETLVYNMRAFTLGYADRNYKDTKKFLPQIIENGGSVPSKYINYIKKINTIIQTLAKKIKFSNGVIKGDFVINNNEIKIIEFAGRLSGGDFCESLVPLSTGYNYVRNAVELCIGKKNIKIPKKIKYKNFVQNRYFFLKSGKITSIRGLNKVKKIKGLKKIKLNVIKNTIIKKATSHGSRAGVFVVEAASQQKLDKIVNQVYSTLKFKINNEIINGDPR